ncbi:hypothetical protein VTN00DRAFT_8929 [Thermoascus crustaceus]|uniref:uncharacterized protein n=1 Tax=Thermoascus crustaceus TaxID=5088 RepID=UPI0037429980
MDIVLDVLDTLVFDHVYAALLPISAETLAKKPIVDDGALLSQYNQNVGRYIDLPPSKWAALSSWSRDDIRRQTISLFAISWFFAVFLYTFSSTISYYFVFDHAQMNHPKFLRNQIRQEIKQALAAIPVMAALTTPFFVAEVRGYTKLYDSLDESPYGTWYTYLQYPFFIAFTDCCIYWIHRGLHHPLIYKRLHKPHHKWIVPTPYASYAFHPVDGWSQSVPYHIYPFLFPLQKGAYIALFTFVTVWTVLIHDGEYTTNSPIINGSACHTMHHLYFNYNYGQFTTLWDRLGGSYRKPNDELFDRNLKLGKQEWDRQAREMERLVKEVEGKDDRSYGEKKDN